MAAHKYFVLVGLLLGIFFVSNQAEALTVSPAKVELGGDPGSTLSGQIEIYNDQEESKTFYTSFENFEAQGESGAPYFIGGDTDLATWITALGNVTLAPGERKNIQFTINIPANAEPGGHFAAIFFGSSPPQSSGGGQVSIGGRLGVLILLSVTGDITQGGGVIEFTTSQGWWISSLPLTFNYRFSNDGSERVKPVGTLTVTNLFGGKTVELNANRRDGNVLPGSIRKFNVDWLSKEQDAQAVVELIDMEKSRGFFGAAGYEWKNFLLGMYKADVQLTYGPDQKQVVASYRFFAFPWQLISIIVVILGGLWFGFKKYNRWIIAKASGRVK